MRIRDNSRAQRINNNTAKSTKALAEATKRLSSGYRINSAADDAAGLAVSEKLRSIDRGLRQGLRNINDGINYTCSVDGASQTIHDMLHRLKEIAVEAANGTYDSVDRDALDLEYQQLVKEIGQITDTADFNGLPLFEKHLEAYGMVEGNYSHNKAVKIDDANCTLRIGYTIDGESKEYTVNIPHGTYDPNELLDMIDDDLYAGEKSLIIGMGENQQFTMQCEGGRLDYIAGSGASLFYETKAGSSVGYLLGVTYFKSNTAKLTIIPGKNDVMNFRIGDDDTMYSVQLDAGSYTHSELIEHMNEKFAAASLPQEVLAVADVNEEGYSIIALSCDETITGLAGNFLLIDTDAPIHSPIYDICMYSVQDNTPAEINGVRSITNDTVIERGRNEYFVLNVSYYDDDGSKTSSKVKVNLLDNGENRRIYASPDDLLARINSELAAADVPVEASFSGSCLKLATTQFGGNCSLSIDKNDVPSDYMLYDLFDRGTLNKVTPSPSNSTYSAAFLQGKKKLDSTTFITADNNCLSFNLETDNGSKRLDLTIAEGDYSSAAALEAALTASLASAYPDMADKLKFIVGDSVTLTANGLKGSEIVSISADSSSSAYTTLIGGTSYSSSLEKQKGSSKPYITYSGGGSGSSNISSTAGKTKPLVTYETVAPTKESQREGKILTYTGISTASAAIDGTSKPVEDISQGEVDDIHYVHTPAEFTLKNVLSQFTAVGKSLEAADLSFAMTNKDGVSSNYSVSIPKGSTVSQAISAIQKAVGAAGTVSASGNDLKFVSTDVGENVKISNITGTLCRYATKDSNADNPAAVTDLDSNHYEIPAKTTLNYAGTHIPYTIDDSCDRLIVNCCGKQFDLTLEHTTYTSLAQLASEITSKLTAANGGVQFGTCSAQGSKLVFTAPSNAAGEITISPASTCRIADKKTTTDPGSSPYYNPATGNIEEPATLTSSSVGTHLPLTVDSTNNTITMDYTSPGGTETLTVTIPDGTYATGNDLAGAINSAIAADPALSGKIKASYSASGSPKGLTFTTVNGGDGYKLSNFGGTSMLDRTKTVASSAGGTVDEANNVVNFPAYIRNSYFGALFNGDGVTVNALNNKASFNINGTSYSFTIPDGVYKGDSGRTQFLDMLNNALAGADVTVNYSGGALTITTNSEGDGASVDLGASNTSVYFKKASSVASPTASRRSSTICKIVGKNNVSSIEIADYNNSMEFDCTENGVNFRFAVSIPTGSYTADSLAAALQTSFDSTLPGSFRVSVVNGVNIQIEGANISGDRAFRNFSGGLFDKVFQNPNFTPIDRHTAKAGSSKGSDVSYIVGRNTMEPISEEEIESGKNVIIYSQLNDELIFDLTYLDEQYKVSLKIPAGEYTPEEIASAIQTEGRKAIGALTDSDGNHLPAEFFSATIGLNAIGASENKTAFTSSDKLVLSMKTPDDGSVRTASSIIDGVRGSAAYRVFYDTSKTPQPTRVLGKSDLSNGITITAGKNDTLTIYCDGEPQTVTLDAGYYKDCQAVCDALNKKYEETGSLIRTLDHNGRLMFYTAMNGDFVLDRYSGSAANDLFYDGAGRDDDTEIGIHFGRRTDSYIMYKKTRVDERLMRINTTGVTTIERALKAINRLDDANAYLSEWRALSGANENRSRHTADRITVYIENLENAESGIRDADIPTEVNALAKQQILQQVQNAMAEREKENQSSILDILA
ncbi:MAG: flagellin [Oscillospiraceae bacterium]